MTTSTRLPLGLGLAAVALAAWACTPAQPSVQVSSKPSNSPTTAQTTSPSLSPAASAAPVASTAPAASAAPAASTAPSASTDPAASSAPAAGMRVEVKIKGFAFDPPKVQVKKGGVVVFTNLDSAGHTATPDQAGFTATRLLAQNESEEVSFATTGTFGYHCAPHPSMQGSVEVLP